MCWHPIFLRLYLNLTLVAKVMRESGIELPTRRTMNDWVGFNYEVISFFFDEMKIREDLAFDKTGQSLHGFVNFGRYKSLSTSIGKASDS
uniref:Transposable element P transposase-like RNase H domain-containing protein n=1 Tax=Amphimedon queenslandica TaxID=400682 RepID=A0A1X7TUU4_AMPQE